jgi:hypothetical protein
MIRWVLTGALCCLLFAGCRERYTTVVREVKPERESEAPSPHPTSADVHPVAPAAPPAASTGPEVDLDGAQLTAPKNWVRKPPRVEFIRAEFSLPRAEGDPTDGRLTVSVAGGGVKQNVDRWRTQFAGKLEKENEQKVKAGGIEVTLVDFSGTFKDQRGPFAPEVESPGYRMLGAIFDIGGQMHFIKAYGPAKTMAARAAEFRAFVESLKQNKPPS